MANDNFVLSHGQRHTNQHHSGRGHPTAKSKCCNMLGQNLDNKIYFMKF
jgi:hypothetical protein